jgi:hypothetical protein
MYPKEAESFRHLKDGFRNIICRSRDVFPSFDAWASAHSLSLINSTFDPATNLGGVVCTDFKWRIESMEHLELINFTRSGKYGQIR